MTPFRQKIASYSVGPLENGSTATALGYFLDFVIRHTLWISSLGIDLPLSGLELMGDGNTIVENKTIALPKALILRHFL